jgi:hypothetical protein
MLCPQCGYMMTAFDKECPRCHGKGVSGAAAVAPPAPTPAPTPAPSPPTSSSSVLSAPPAGSQPPTVQGSAGLAPGRGTFEAFHPITVGQKTFQVVSSVIGVVLLIGGVITLSENFIAALTMIIFGMMVPMMYFMSVNIKRSNQIADTLKGITGGAVYVGGNGRGISVDSRQRSVVVSTEQKDGFWLRRLPPETLKVELHHDKSIQLTDRSFSGTGCLLSGCIFGPITGILGGMALGTQKLQETNSYRVRLFTKDPQYPEHTLDFGQDRDRAERFEAVIKSMQ